MTTPATNKYAQESTQLADAQQSYTDGAAAIMREHFGPKMGGTFVWQRYVSRPLFLPWRVATLTYEDGTALPDRAWYGDHIVYLAPELKLVYTNTQSFQDAYDVALRNVAHVLRSWRGQSGMQTDSMSAKPQAYGRELSDAMGPMQSFLTPVFGGGLGWPM